MLPELDSNEQPQPLTSEHIVRIGAQTLLVLIVVAGIVVMCCGCGSPASAGRWKQLDSEVESMSTETRELLSLVEVWKSRQPVSALKPENVQ